MKALFLSAAAVAALAVTPVIAQTASTTVGERAKQPVTRAAMVETVQQHFVRLDADKDGFVTKAEGQTARSAIRGHAGQGMEHHTGAMFDHMDADKNGSISRAEFDAVHEKKAAHSGKGVRKGRHGMGGRIFAMADSNNDGRVSLQEATAAATAHFDRADANRDGVLTPDERRNAFRAMRSSTTG